MTKVALVKKMYQLFAENNIEAIREVFSEELKWKMMEGFPNGSTYNGIDEVYENVFGYFKKYWESWEAVSERFIETDEGVFVVGYYKGTFKKTQKEVTAKFAAEYKIRNDQIVEYQQYTDTHLIVQATQ